ncbi:membrane protein MLC1 isoform X3 [Girardinichthys multiradiatus]|uniref:membrane protein MLC1 isoform X3 n=1 Tax=Girardinichthys multiradiatus TaxID=208333 RepID=UPI001FACA4EA|nr:membrane protein MLC1 isoform X3 [Girardinichthys multiradiatus]
MHREDLSAREEFTYSRTSTLERGNGTLGRRGDRSLERRPDWAERERPERNSYAVDVRASDLQLAQVEPLKHPCFSYRAWLYSVLIGGSLLIASGFSLYLGNVFPVAMDYLRCAAGSGIPAAIASFAIAKKRHVAVSDFQVVYVSAFAVTTTCLVWFGCKLVLNPSAVNINFNLILMIVLEVLMATTVILSARSADDCCCHRKSYDRPVVIKPAVFPTRLLKAYSVEVLIAISSVTSPLLFSASGYLSSSVISFIEIFLHDVPTAKQSYDILLLILMVLLLVQAVLTSATVVHCAAYKSQLRMGAPECEDSMQTTTHYNEQQTPNGTVQDYEKDRTWKAVLVQMAQ